jgi:hypothetical protein
MASIVLQNLKFIDQEVELDCSVQGDDLFEINNFSKTSGSELDFSNTVCFPSLINSHDHLEFNLFPQFGNPPYKNYFDWGHDIHIKSKKEIESVLSIPFELRFKWGILKNIICGVTKIVNHGQGGLLVQQYKNFVYQHYQYIHSMGTDKYWSFKLNSLFDRRYVMVHLGEGVGKSMNREIELFKKLNLFNRKVIPIHALSISAEQAQNFSAVVWCPMSNLFLYHKTAAVELIKNIVPVLFGTDSTLTSHANIWNHLRCARSLGLLTDQELFRSVTSIPKSIFNFRTSDTSDFIVCKKKTTDLWNSFYEINPEDILLIVKDKIVLLADDTYLPLVNRKSHLPVKVGESVKWIPSEWVQLVRQLEQYDLPLPLSIRSIS